MKDKKPFKETKFAKFLNKAKDIAPELGGVAMNLATGNIGGAVEKVGELLSAKAKTDNRYKELYFEFEINRMQFEKDVLTLEIEDRKSARDREVEIAKTGKTDWLMYATGLTALLAFLSMISWAMFWNITEAKEAIFFHILGFVEGTALSIFTYYFGSSKGSADKTKMMDK
jgi:hypothetical protein